MHAAPFRRDFVIRTAKRRVELADVDLKAHRLFIRIIGCLIEVELLRLPGLAIFGKQFGIGSGFESLLGDDPGDLMMSVPIPRRSGESRDDDFGTKLADHSHNVAKHLIVSPFSKTIFGALRETKLI